MNSQELLYALALLQVDGVGDVIAKKLIHHCGSAEKVFSAKPHFLKSIDGIGDSFIKKLKENNVAALKKAETEIRFIEENDVQTIFYTESDYPERLKHCFDSPLILFSKGTIAVNQRKIISIVGTRDITPHGTEFCKKLVEEMAVFNPIIVSGFAYGVDIVAHKAALENNLQTIAVLAHGLNQIYPKTHSKYIASIKENGGFLTEFWSDSNPDKENFVQRNRIVAGMSEATIVIESAEKGGSLITANLANDYSREVFAVPGRITDKYSQGCNTLIKTQKAHLLTSAADIVYHLNWELKTESKPIQKQLFISLNQEEQLIHDYLNKNGKQLLDVISMDCNLPVFKLSSLLLNMELKGVIRPLPGKMFEVI